jgi:hypothetical protein
MIEKLIKMLEEQLELIEELKVRIECSDQQ